MVRFQDLVDTHPKSPQLTISPFIDPNPTLKCPELRLRNEIHLNSIRMIQLNFVVTEFKIEINRKMVEF